MIMTSYEAIPWIFIRGEFCCACFKYYWAILIECTLQRRATWTTIQPQDDWFMIWFIISVVEHVVEVYLVFINI